MLIVDIWTVNINETTFISVVSNTCINHSNRLWLIRIEIVKNVSASTSLLYFHIFFVIRLKTSQGLLLLSKSTTESPAAVKCLKDFNILISGPCIPAKLLNTSWTNHVWGDIVEMLLQLKMGTAFVQKRKRK